MIIHWVPLLNWQPRIHPHVRGVHFQPVSYFGRYAESPTDAGRITLPELMRRLEEQTDGALQATHFMPPGCEHSHCSFHANYMVREDGRLQKLSAEGKCGCQPRPASEGADKAKAFVKRQWAAPEKILPMADAPDALDALSAVRQHILLRIRHGVSGCLDFGLERLKVLYS